MKDYILFIDTEASGLPKNWNAPYSKKNNWPHAIQVAWVIYRNDGTEVKYENHYVKNNDFKIASSAIKIHGITRDYLNKEGKSRHEILLKLNEDIQKYKPLVVGHFVELDYHILAADYFRSDIDNHLKDVPLFCTMIATKGYHNDSKRTFLKLCDIYKQLFNETLLLHHSAIVDARATAEVFFELVNRGNINDDAIAQQRPVKEGKAVNKNTGCSFAFMFALLLTAVIIILK